MAAITTPPDTQFFTCFQAIQLPEIRIPLGFDGLVKLFPDGYFRSWEKQTNPDQRVYLSQAFRNKVLPTFDPVRMSNTPFNQAVYCWRARSGIRVTWDTVYQHFPKHGPNADKPHVSSWIFLRQLAFGWDKTLAVVPKNASGALLMLGDAGLPKSDPTGASASRTGQTRILNQISFFASVGPATWTIGLPQNEGSDKECPSDTVLLTVQ